MKARRGLTERAAAFAAVAVISLLVPVPARAFHDGGVAECDGCHSMHGAGADGALPGAIGPYLLQGADASSRCLACHSGSVQSGANVLTTGLDPGLPPINYSPGGDFAWLQKSYSWTGSAGASESPGDRHGHNVVASDFGLAADGTLTTSPGGWYPADKLSCTSCHDPHGKFRMTTAQGAFDTTGNPIAGSGSYGDPGSLRQPTSTAAIGAYRLLAGHAYAPHSTASTPPFQSDPPVALAPSLFNKREGTADVRVAYGAGMSEWCANCHGAMHSPYSGSSDSFTHPSGNAAKLVGDTGAIYNEYVKTGDLTGSWYTSYTSLVPYEEGTTDRSVLAQHARSDGSVQTGPGTGQENVMCLSCHRAHASGWDFAMRWNSTTEFIVVEGKWPGIDAGGAAANPAFAQGRTQAETRAAMYDHDPSRYASYQTSLCNKCHAK